MIPLYDDNPTRKMPWVTMALIAVNFAAFAYELSLSDAQFESLISRYAFTASSFFSSPIGPTGLLTLITATFLHGGWLHLIGNMLYLWIFGNNIEDRLGATRYLLFYLSAGVAAIMAQALTDPLSEIPLVGASGAIAGVLGAYMVLYPRARVITLIPIFFFVELAAIPAVFVIGFWFLIQIAQGVGSIGAGAVGGVAWWAHVGGFVFGLLAMAPLGFAELRRRRRR